MDAPSSRKPGTTTIEHTFELRSLLHDVGHGLATLSCLVEAVRVDPALPVDAHRIIDMFEQQAAMLLRLVWDGLWCEQEPEPVAVRLLVGQIAALARLSGRASVELLPGKEVNLYVGPTLVWRTVSNVVDNAVRAAGPNGRVTIAITRAQPDEVVIEVVDNGPGPVGGPAGMATLGLDIVSGLLAECGGRFDLRPAPPRGTRARLTFPDHARMPASGERRPR